MWNNIEKFIVFTDLSDFTLKSSLLTPKQLKELVIDKQDEIILPLIKKYNWELIKYIWDSYLILFNDILNSVNFSIDLQNILLDFNKNIKFSLNKLEIKIVINYWNILKKRTILWTEYFWDSLNISSRILEKTPKNKIFITKSIFDFLDKTKFNIQKLWIYSFKWVIYKIPLFELIYTDIDLWNSKELLLWKKEKNNTFDIKEVDNLIFKVSSVAFILTIQPIPLLDNYFLVLLHIYLLKEIALLYNINLSDSQIKQIISTIFLSIWWIYSTNQLITWIWKIGLPIIWWYLLAPWNFALTYWLWKIFSNYFYYKQNNEKLTNENIKNIFLWTKDKGFEIAKKQKKDILESGKKYKEIFINNIDSLKQIFEKIKDIIKK